MTSDNPDNREYELKLRARPGDLGKFKRAIAAIAGDKGDWTEAALSSRYFDTRDGRLAKRGVSLRLRGTGAEATQTVKVLDTGGIIDRCEWVQPSSGTEPDLAALPAEARRAVGTVIAGELAPVIAVDVTRQSTTIRRDAVAGPRLVVEAVIDHGSVTANGMSEPLVECELELMEGDLPSFFQLASDIHASCPLPLSHATKVGRGYRLLNGAGPAARKAPRIELHGGMSIHQALASVFAAGIANILDNEAACLDGKDTEGVHQARVSIRRLRSATKVFGPYVEPSRFAWLADDLKWLGNALGPARDWDVYVEETLAAVDVRGIDKTSVAALLRAARRRRKAAYASLRKTLHSPRYARLMFRLTAFVALEGWLPHPFDPKTPVLRRLKKTAPRILHRLYRKLLRQADGLADLDMEARHRVRIRLKKLRYAVDFLQGVYPSGDTRNFLERLRRLQDQFGHINDAAQATRLTEELTGATPADGAGDALAFAAGEVLRWHARTLQEANGRLLADWRAFVATRPFWERGSSDVRTGSPP